MIAAVLCATALLSGWAAASRAQPAVGGATELVLHALGLLGVPYRYGGDHPASGFDCSGLVRFVARTVLGVQLPRQAEAISRAGIEVAQQQLQPGDLVFFNTAGRPFSHVGFYLGEGQFVHAPAQRGQVRIEQMSQPYWQARFNGARRFEVLATEAAAVDSTGFDFVGPPRLDELHITVEP
jgi:cell wall-associated NlpC family hydrolase